MKVLIVCNTDSNPNPFVYTLANGLCQLGVDVVCSVSDFWENWNAYDIIHLQWPDLLVRGEAPYKLLNEHLHIIKKAGKVIIITCHNLHPHYGKDKLASDVYDVAYSNADSIVHMGHVSQEILSKKNPKAYHVIIPHHVYNQIYSEIPSKEEALSVLRLSTSNKYILCFGAFRSKEERNLIADLSDRLRNNRVSILAPGLYSFSWWNKERHLPAIKRIIQLILFKIRHPNCVIAKGHVSDEMLPYYYAASEIALIHRPQILNSGNVPMAFLMGKVVVGPSTGNVGEILKETGNPVFEPYNNSTIINALETAFRLAKNGQGERNQNYAFQNLRTEIIAQKYNQLYIKMSHQEVK